ncbi:uncharacterized protein LOC101849944 isoform X2 [Aplysia californica]|uniref:Uncharacterized protein LOC101849944 isoform X2 n=1 Tax=Aplysia californica TaxID=6500 RepID=A0ABM0JWU9_APLCA|nr:uncharacterized protein LOC101849944 isoform X2 [Aplysia californica]
MAISLNRQELEMLEQGLSLTSSSSSSRDVKQREVPALHQEGTGEAQKDSITPALKVIESARADQISSGTDQERQGTFCPTQQLAPDAVHHLCPTTSPRLIKKTQASASASHLRSPPLLKKLGASSGHVLSTGLVLPPSPKLRSKSESVDAVLSCTKPSSILSASSSPTSPARKYFKYLSSPAASYQRRRGSEPVLDGISGTDFQQIQMSVTDRRWEKLRSILVAMKDEPVDIETIMVESSPPDLLSKLQEKVTAQEELCSLRKEISSLHDSLDKKELELHQAEVERDSALAFIRQLKVGDQTPATEKPEKSTGDAAQRRGVLDLYKNGVEELKSDNVSKEDVLDVLSSLLEEVLGQRSYLDRLMSVVLQRAPWMLEEVDTAGPWSSGHFPAEDDDDYEYCHDSDDEVWC